MTYFLGIMSGTSMDALDAVLVGYANQEIRVLAFQTQTYSHTFRQKLLRNAHPTTSSVFEVAELNIELSRLAAQLVESVLKTSGYDAAQIECVGYHGQTLWHDPKKGITFQIGDGPTLSALCKIPVVNNFRTKDMAYGGQGAPLVPFAHEILFRKNTNAKISVHNLGGISNVSYFSQEKNLAFDTGPANLLLDGLAQKLLGQNYDRDGHVARAGRVHEGVLQHFLQAPYFRFAPPKSTGREEFGEDFLQSWLKATADQGLSPEDQLATATAFSVRSIIMAYEDFLLPLGLDTVILCGGGAKNTFFVEQIAKQLPVRVVTSTHFGLDPQQVEAVCFAILGHLGFHRQINQYADLTGAKQPSSLGQISYP